MPLVVRSLTKVTWADFCGCIFQTVQHSAAKASLSLAVNWIGTHCFEAVELSLQGSNPPPPPPHPQINKYLRHIIDTNSHFSWRQCRPYIHPEPWPPWRSCHHPPLHPTTCNIAMKWNTERQAAQKNRQQEWKTDRQTERNKLVNPSKCLQSQGHVKKWPTVVASLKFVACSVVDIIQHWMFAFADPPWPCIKVMVIKTSMSIYAMHRSTIMPSLHVIAKILSEILQVKK